MFINFYELLIFLIFIKRLDFFQETGIFRDISQKFLNIFIQNDS